MERTEIERLRDLPIEEVAGRLGLRVTHHKALCPFHDDHHASLSFHRSRNTYRCFVCDAHGDSIELVRGVLKTGFGEACRWLGGSVCLPPSEPRPASARGKDNRPAFDPRRYARFFEHPSLNEAACRFLYGERRLDPRVVRWCRLNAWTDPKGTDWLQIPYYDAEGLLTGVQSRRLTGAPDGQERRSEPRFRFPRGSRCHIYNLPVLKRLAEGDELWITEGCSDCWAMLSSGRKAIAIPSATLLSRDDCGLLKGLEGKVAFHMYPDRDMPGERLFLDLKAILPGLEHHQLGAGCKDYSEHYLAELSQKVKSASQTASLDEINTMVTNPKQHGYEND